MKKLCFQSSECLFLLIVLLLSCAPQAFAEWQAGRTMSSIRHDAAIVQTQDGKIYAIGGLEAPGYYYRNMDVYNRTTDEWTISSVELPAKRSGARGIVDSTGKIWIMGGHNPIDGIFCSVLSYHPTSSTTWEEGLSMEVARSGMGVAITPDDTIYVFGGSTPEGGFVTTAEKSVRGGPWVEINPMSVARYLPGYVYYNGYIYAIGGQNTVNLSSAERYNIAEGIWEPINDSMPGAKSGPCVFVCNNEIYVVGGWNNGMTSNCYVLNPTTLKWRTEDSAAMYEGFTCGGSGVPFVVGGQRSPGSASDHFSKYVVLQIIRPNGGETFEGGTSEDIQWSTVGNMSSVKIEYSTDNGDSWVTEADSTANTGVYNWTVPSVNSASCLIKISDPSNPNINDVSDDPFTIVTIREALVDLDPDTLNLKSNGRYVNAFTTLPEGFSVYDIDTGSIGISMISGDQITPTLGIDPTFTPVIGDRDEDGILDLTVKFDRQAVIAIPLLPGDRSITVSFKLNNGIKFEGSDTIRVIDRGK